MRSVVMSSRIRRLLKVSSLGVLGIAVAGCSSGFQRFDRSIYDEAVPQQAAQNPFPGDIDPTTTAGINRRFEPLKPVAPQPVPQAVYHNPEPTQVQQQTYQAPTYAPSRQPLATYTPPQSPSVGSSGVISGTALPKPAATSAPITYAPPKPDNQTAYAPTANADAITTASIGTTSTRAGGWTSTGGTTITIREGETLYNLSKRYGVPVSEIRKANSFSASRVLKTGEKVTIPNYVYSPSAAISAPDNNPKTRAASAHTGYLGAPNTDFVAVPTKRPQVVAAVSPTGVTQDRQTPRYVPKGHVSPPTQQTSPDYSIITSSVDQAGSYTVRSGDSLSAIASRHGTTVSKLKSANRLTGNSIRSGQKLVIPGAIDTTTTASVPTVPAGVDPIVTGSTNGTAIDTKEPTPARTGISEFRWPVKGRVVSEFGGTVASGKNEGIDISVPEGTAVRAAENGVVIYAGSEITAFGNLLLVRHDDEWVSAYAHNRDFEVKRGDKVRRGQIIARSGKTGSADRPKVHFELRRDSVPVNPKKYLTGS